MSDYDEAPGPEGKFFVGCTLGLMVMGAVAVAILLMVGCAPRGDDMGNTRELSREVGRITR